MLDRIDLDSRDLVVRVLSFDKVFGLPLENEEMNQFSAKSGLLEGSLLNERMEVRMGSKQIKE